MPLGTGFEELLLCLPVVLGGKLFSAACYSSVPGGGVKKVFPVFSGFSGFYMGYLLLTEVTTSISCVAPRKTPQYLAVFMLTVHKITSR